ncbi:carbohydrate-binding protein [candidate division KSB1 bacterium]|nr:carbohydrate-binding protein [candidate division KSB1 bacterium]
MMSRITPLLIISQLFTSVLFLANAQTPVYLDPSASIDTRVGDLLSRMTLEEKVGQMTQADHEAVDNVEDIKTYFLGSVLSGGGSDPAAGNDPVNWADLYDRLQQKALATRLQIPLIYGVDAVHGHSNVTGAVIFPHNIGLGATRNPDLVKQAARVTAVEVAATGIDWTFAPCVTVPQDERWGRTYEGFGETPELVESLSGAFVNGLQTNSLNQPTSIVACAKHYLGDGGTEGGVDQGNTILSEQELRAIHLPGYIAAMENDVKTIMASYSSWNGTKLHGHKYLLTDVLKEELGFKGFIVSDWRGIDQLPGDYASDVETSINAGIDMVMVPDHYVEFFTTLVSLVEQNRVSPDRIDDAVRRILSVKFEMGLFERPMTDRSLLPRVGSKDHRSIARQCVRESQVLLKKNDGILPLPKENIKVLVAGRHAHDIGLQCGGWTIEWQGAAGDITTGTTVLEGLQKVAPNVEFIFDADGNFTETKADFAIAVIGEAPYAEGAGDAKDLTIGHPQIKMVRKLKKQGIPVITLLISGRPMIIDPVLHDSDVFMASWLPGTEADGIAEIVFGDHAPTGVLPMTWPKSMAQLPINIGDDDYDPLFAYGFGMTDLSDSETGSAPVFQSAMLTEDGLHVELAFNKSMTLEGSANAQFHVTKNNSTPVKVIDYQLSEFSDKIIELGLDTGISDKDSLTVSYVSGHLVAKDGGNLALFQNQPVINLNQFVLPSLRVPGRIQAEDWTRMSGVQTENSTDMGGGLNVGWIDDRDWIEYDCYFETAGTYVIVFRVASLEIPGKIKVLADGKPLFTKEMPVTEGWQNWKSVTERAEFAQGTTTLRIVAERGGFNLNWIEFFFLTSVERATNLISGYNLAQNYPNPFNPVTTIDYTLGSSRDGNQAAFTPVQLRVFDLLGREVATLVNEQQKPGHYSVQFDATGFASGIYFYQLKTPAYMQTRKFMLVR